MAKEVENGRRLANTFFEVSYFCLSRTFGELFRGSGSPATKERRGKKGREQGEKKEYNV